MTYFKLIKIIFLFALTAIKVLAMEQYIEIELNEEYIKETKAESSNISALRTHFSPRKKSQHFSLNDPINNELIKSVKLITVNNNIDDKKQASSGKRKASSAEKEAAAEKENLVINYRPIKLEQNNFNNGKWAYIDPFALSGPVLIDADSDEWYELIDIFFKEYENFSDIIDFISSIIEFYHKNINNILNMSHIPNGIDDIELVCRHHATMSLPLISKILSDSRSLYSGSIQQIVGDEIGQNWETKNAGHVWNFLIIKKSELESKWLVDVHNKRFINLSESPDFKYLKLIKVLARKNIVINDLINKHNIDYLNYTRLTKELLNISPKTKRILSQQPEAYMLAAKKYLLNYMPQNAKYLIECSKPLEHIQHNTGSESCSDAK